MSFPRDHIIQNINDNIIIVGLAPFSEPVDTFIPRPVFALLLEVYSSPSTGCQTLELFVQNLVLFEGIRRIRLSLEGLQLFFSAVSGPLISWFLSSPPCSCCRAQSFILAMWSPDRMVFAWYPVSAHLCHKHICCRAHRLWAADCVLRGYQGIMFCPFYACWHGLISSMPSWWVRQIWWAGYWHRQVSKYSREEAQVAKIGCYWRL